MIWKKQSGNYLGLIFWWVGDVQLCSNMLFGTFKSYNKVCFDFSFRLYVICTITYICIEPIFVVATSYKSYWNSVVTPSTWNLLHIIDVNMSYSYEVNVNWTSSCFTFPSYLSHTSGKKINHAYSLKPSTSFKCFPKLPENRLSPHRLLKHFCERPAVLFA